MNENVKPSNIFSQWSKGIDSEREFWSSWFETKGLQWPNDYAERIKPKRDLSHGFRSYSEKQLAT
jgi:hypothetical protein